MGIPAGIKSGLRVCCLNNVLIWGVGVQWLTSSKIGRSTNRDNHYKIPKYAEIFLLMRTRGADFKAASFSAIAAMGLCSAVLSGCSVKTSADAASEPQATGVEQIEVTVSNVITTVGKPTKTIETPWGPREIYDPSRDEKIISVYQGWYDGEFSFKSSSPRTKALLQKSSNIHTADYLRLGCMKVKWNVCGLNDYVFQTDCKNLHAFGDENYSSCEVGQYVRLRAVRYDQFSCPVSDSPVENMHGYKYEPTFDASLARYFDRECLIWRGDEDEDYWKDIRILPGALPISR